MRTLAECREEAEAGFETRTVLAPLQQETRDTTECCLRFPKFAPVLDALRKGVDTNTCSVRFLVPREARGIAVLLQWKHQLQTDGSVTADVPRTNGHLFRLWHLLRQNNADHHLFIEGPPYECRYIQDQQQLIPETTLPIFSDQGQQYLIDHPAVLQDVLTQHRWTFEQAVWHKEDTTYHGIEKPAMHQRSMNFLQQHLRALEGIDTLTKRIINGMLAGSVLYTRTQPRNVLFENREYPLESIIQKCQQYCDAIHALEQSNKEREDEIVDRMEETIVVGEIPKVSVGISHGFAIRKKCAERSLAVCVVTPEGLMLEPTDYFDFKPCPENQAYHIANHILPQLRAIAADQA